jgi:bacteriocin biosynthesis cyclodehydratase domain-containing protein
VLPGIIGTLQANEILKLIVGYGDPLVGRLLTFDAQSTRFGEVKVRRDPQCPTCGEGAEQHREQLEEASA